jgi:hypothetical protein
MTCGFASRFEDLPERLSPTVIAVIVIKRLPRIRVIKSVFLLLNMK